MDTLHWLGLAVYWVWLGLMALCGACTLLALILSRRPAALIWGLLWAAHATLSYIGALIGLPLVGALSVFSAWERQVSRANGRTLWQWRPIWAYPWSNLEDGVYPGSVPTAWEAFKWSGLRNKVSNLRFTSMLGFTVRPERVGYVGNDRNLYMRLPNDSRPVLWSLTWQDLYAGLWLVFPGIKRQLRIGWTLIPDDARGFDPRDLRQRFCGFTLQFNSSE